MTSVRDAAGSGWRRPARPRSRRGKEARMHSNEAEAPRGIMTERRAVLDALPADEPRHDLRQSPQLLIPLLEPMHALT
jgi:hypothetical protein